MKAVTVKSPGGIDVLQWQDVGDPVLRHDTELLIRVRAASVNPVDAKLRRNGAYLNPPGPTILGCDGAGIVEAVGSAVTRFSVDDAVYYCHGGLGGPQGSYAEYIVIDERHVARKPASLDFTQAAAVPLALITAWESMVDRGKVRQGQSVLVHGGAGGVGHLAMQLAKRAGAFVCATVSDDAKATFARDFGADETVNYRLGDFVPAVLDWSDGGGVELALDTVGGATFTQTFAAVTHYGDLVTLLQPAHDTDWKVARQRNLRIIFELMLTPQLFGIEDRLRHHVSILEQAAALFDAGELKIHVGATLPLSQAAEAHALIERGSMTGKLILVVG
jgi:NADPH2:quinone reductase